MGIIAYNVPSIAVRCGLNSTNFKNRYKMKKEQNSDEPQHPALRVGDVGGSYYWYCRFTFKDDNLECYLTEHNNCKTFKELRRWWRIEKPNLKLLAAVRK